MPAPKRALAFPSIPKTFIGNLGAKRAAFGRNVYHADTFTMLVEDVEGRLSNDLNPLRFVKLCIGSAKLTNPFFAV